MSRLSGRTVGLVVLLSLLAVVAGTASAAPTGGAGHATVADAEHTSVAGVGPDDGGGNGSATACGGGTSWVPDAVGTAEASDDVRVIVTYESGVARSSCAGSAVSAVGGDVIGGRDVDIVPMAVARVDPAAIDALESRPGIASVDRDARFRASGFRSGNGTTGGTGEPHRSGQSVPWGVERINATAAAGVVTDSEMRDVQVAVLDSGIDLDHPDLRDNLVWGADHIDGNDRTGLQYADDVYGHGTHVAGTIAARNNSQGVLGVAPNVELYSIRVLNESNFGYYSWWIEGLDSAVKGPDGTIGTADDPEVISMSLGGTTDCCGLHSAIRSAEDHALLVAAAGNNGDGNTSTNDIEFPGKYPETLAVAATATDDLTTRFSAEGEQVDVAAPGNDIRSTTDPDHAFGDEYGSKSGTSMATPHVSGAAALVLAQDLADGSRDLSDADIKAGLLDSATDIHGSGIDRYSGHGLLRAFAAMKTTGVDDPPTAAFTVDPASPVTNETITLNASNATDDFGIASYNWSVGGTEINTTDPLRAVTFRQAGLYNLSLTVIDTVGQSDTTERTLLVDRNDPPTAAFTVTPEPPLAGETITLNASTATDDAGIAGYNWTVGGTHLNATDPVTSASVPRAGSYDVTLTVVDTSGETNTTSRTITVVDPLRFSTPDVVSPSKVNETTPLEVAVTVGNVVPNASTRSAMDLSISLNGSVLNTTGATVTEGGTTTLSLPLTPTTAGSYDVTVDGSVAFDGTTYNATSAGARMTVLAENDSLVPPITGTDAPTNLDGDPVLEDVDGDGDGDVFDALAYYNNRDSDSVRDNPDRFDVDGDGAAGTVFDALALYQKVTG